MIYLFEAFQGVSSLRYKNISKPNILNKNDLNDDAIRSRQINRTSSLTKKLPKGEFGLKWKVSKLSLPARKSRTGFKSVPNA